LIDYYRVLLPDWVFKNEYETEIMARKYLQRYPDYSLVKVVGKYAICKKK